MGISNYNLRDENVAQAVSSWLHLTILGKVQKSPFKFFWRLFALKVPLIIRLYSIKLSEIRTFRYLSQNFSIITPKAPVKFVLFWEFPSLLLTVHIFSANANIVYFRFPLNPKYIHLGFICDM